MGTIKNGLPLGKSAAAKFLLRLSETCDIEAAARASGFHPARAYALRRVDAAFRQAWAEIVRQGVDRVETALLANAVAAIASARGTAPAAAMTPDHLLKLLGHYRQRVGDKPEPEIEPSMDEIDAEIERVLDTVRSRLQTQEGQMHAHAA